MIGQRAIRQTTNFKSSLSLIPGESVLITIFSGTNPCVFQEHFQHK